MFRLLSVETFWNGRISNGATINYNFDTAHLVIAANDFPCGILSWKNSLEVTTEYNMVNSSALLVIQREFGVFGNIEVSFETIAAVDFGSWERPARPYLDYSPVNGTLVLSEGQKEGFVFIPIRHVCKPRILAP